MIVTSRWAKGKIGDIVQDTQYGTSLKANDQGRGIPVLRMNNITYGGAFDLTSIKHVELSSGDVEQYTVRRGDLLFNRTNSQELVGKTAAWMRDEPFAFAGYLVRLRVKPHLADPRFLAAWFNTTEMKTLLRMRAKPSINMSNINATEVLKFPVVLPPLTEQKRIAEVLDRAEALRTKRRAALAQLDTLTQSIFLDLFGDPATNPMSWPTSTVGDVANVQGGLQISHARSKLPIQVPYLRVGNVYRNMLDLREIKLMQVTQAEAERTKLAKDDLLIVEGHGNPDEIGRSCLWDGSIESCVHQNHIIRARFAVERVDPLYASYFLNSQGGRRHLLKAGRTTTGLNTISVADVRETPIAVPPSELQQDFARRIASVEKLKATMRASLAELDALFASLQHRAFRGEL